MPAHGTPVEDAQPVVLELLQQLFAVSGAVNAEVRGVLAEFDLSDTASGLLWLLDPDQPPLRMREIAAILGCDPSNVTLIGDKLQHAGLVIRQAHPQDRRSRVLALTDTGSQLRKRLLGRLGGATPLSTLTARERQQLGHLLTKLGSSPRKSTTRRPATQA